MNKQRNEIKRTICVWCEKVITRTNMNVDMTVDERAKMNADKCTVWLETTIATCNPCFDSLDLKKMSAENLKKAEMNMYAIMSERIFTIASSLWCMNENVRSSLWRSDPRSEEKPEKMSMDADVKMNMSLRMPTERNVNTVVTPSLIEYRNSIVRKIASMR